MSRKETFLTDINTGLSSSEVEERVNSGKVNFDTGVKTKTVKQIVLENVFTLFNIINMILGVAIIAVGSFKNLLFLLIVLANTLISIYQEVRTKKTLDKIELETRAKYSVIRNSIITTLNSDEIVLDDIIILKPGNKVIVDSIIRDGECEVDESAITGEAKTIIKNTGDHILSGSYIVSGTVKAQVEHVGSDNFVAKLAEETSYLKPISSEIMQSLNKIVETISIIIVPVGILLFYRQLYLTGNSVTNAVVNTSAAIIGMIPEGLVLLTSTVLAVSVYNLSKENVLVQDLYCIESLARVDVLCLDKTGTITTGELEVEDEIKKTDVDTKKIISTIVASTKDENPTSIALIKKYGKESFFDVKKVIPFSSRSKMSGVVAGNKKYVIGAPEFILNKKNKTKYMKEIDEYSKKYRTLCLVEESSSSEKLLSIFLLQDKVRENAKEVLDYFKKNDVTLKIISGDNPETVKNIAEKAGLNNLKIIDGTKLKTDDDENNAILNYDIIGRVTPEQKRNFVIALQNAGHTVAMTGDGVNDVLALKEADCSIAMKSGADSTKNVSNLVLLDSDFKSMPKIVSEGRRTINNIERSATLFLTKTIYACTLSILFIFITRSYPFIPIQLTLASVSTIGIPSFMLSFEPNNDRVKKGFLRNVLKRSVPPALTIVTIVLLITLFGYLLNMPYKEISTLSVLMTSIISFILLYKISKPLNKYRRTLLISMIVLFLFNFFTMRKAFSFANFNLRMIILLLVLLFLTYVLYYFYEEKLKDILEKTKNKIDVIKNKYENN